MSRTTENYQGEVEKHELSPFIIVRILGIKDKDEGTLSNVYLTDWPSNIQYFDENGDAVTYVACGISFDKLSATSDTEIDGGTIRIDNTDLSLGKLVLAHDLNKAKVEIKRVLYEFLDNELYSLTLFKGYLRQYQVTEHDMTMTLVSMFDLIRKAPKRLHWNYCPWGFKGPECAYTGEDTSCDHTLTSCKLKGNEANFGGFPYLNASSDIRDPL